MQETEYVFLKQNDFPERFNNLKKNQGDCVLRIGETGFGTGLNFLVTAYHWLQISDLNCTLEYTSVEKYPLTKSQIKQVYATFKKTWPQLSLCCSELSAQYPPDFSPLEQASYSPLKQIQFKLFDDRIRLKLIIDDAAAGLKQLLTTAQKNSQKKMDAWYLDGFAPAKNPDMWQTELFKTIAKLSKSGTTISTFTSAGIVRRGLIEAGFNITKVPGSGKKREILSGVKQ